MISQYDSDIAEFLINLCSRKKSFMFRGKRITMVTCDNDGKIIKPKVRRKLNERPKTGEKQVNKTVRRKKSKGRS